MKEAKGKVLFIFIYLFLIGIHSMQPLPGMELQQKETQKDYSIQEICLERTYS